MGRKRIRSLPEESTGEWGAALSPGGKVALTQGEDGITAVAWNVSSGKRLARPRARANIEIALFSPKGTYALFLNEDRSAEIWSTARWQRQATFRAQADVEAWRGASFTPDERFVAVLGSAGPAQVVETETGARVASFGRADDDLSGVTFDPTGRLLFAGGENGVAVYSCDVCLPDDALVDVAAGRVTRDFTRDERQTYLHD